jgi:hypothetical protein
VVASNVAFDDEGVDMRDEHDDLEASTELAWTGFRQRLADRLAGSEEDDVLLIEVETGVDEDELDGAAPYVQFVAWGEAMLRAEVSSNHYLDERYELTSDDELLLAEIGWSEPAYDEDGDPVAGEANFHADAPQREADRVAVMAVRALREAFGCPHPTFVVADGLERETPVVEPSPAVAEEAALTYPDGHDHLQSLVDAALEVTFESPAVHDEDGDLPIDCGHSRVFVRALEDKPEVEIFADIVVGVRDRDRATAEAARLNLRSADHQFVLRGDRLVMRTALVAWPFSPTQLRVVVGHFCHEVDDIAAEAATAVGGHRFLEPSPPDVPDALDEDDHAGLVTLLEILHTGRVAPATVAGLFDNDRRALVHQIYRIRAGGQSCGDHAEEVVLDHLRRALRFVADREALRELRAERSRRTRRTPSSQLSLLPDEDVGQDSLGVGWGT